MELVLSWALLLPASSNEALHFFCSNKLTVFVTFSSKKFRTRLLIVKRFLGGKVTTLLQGFFYSRNTMRGLLVTGGLLDFYLRSRTTEVIVWINQVRIRSEQLRLFVT